MPVVASGVRAPGRAPRVSPRTSAATAPGCATRPSAGSATSTRRSACRRNTAAVRRQSSPGSGRERSPALTPLAALECLSSARSPCRQRRARRPGSSRSSTGRRKRSASRSEPGAGRCPTARSAGGAHAALCASRPCRWTTSGPRAEQAAWMLDSWRSWPRASEAARTSRRSTSTRQSPGRRCPRGAPIRSCRTTLATSRRRTTACGPSQTSSRRANSSPSRPSATLSARLAGVSSAMLSPQASPTTTNPSPPAEPRPRPTRTRSPSTWRSRWIGSRTTGPHSHVGRTSTSNSATHSVDRHFRWSGTTRRRTRSPAEAEARQTLPSGHSSHFRRS